MNVEAKDIVDTIDLYKSDALLPIYECVVNSIISLMKVDRPDKKIEVLITRGGTENNTQTASLFDRVVAPISEVTIIDNGEGFTDLNFKSFSAPFSKINKKYGCKGFGRFSVLAVFRQIEVTSIFYEDGKWRKRIFTFDADNEIQIVEDSKLDSENIPFTKVRLIDCYNDDLKPFTAKNCDVIAKAITDHCFMYYLSGTLPQIYVGEKIEDKFQTISVEGMFKLKEKDHEKTITLGQESFSLYILRNEQVTSRKYNYVTFCANSRRVGHKYDLAKVNSLYTYPIVENGKTKFLDIYVVSSYLDNNVNNQRNGFKIPDTTVGGSFEFGDDFPTIPSIEDILRKIGEEVSSLYQSYALETQRQTVQKVRSYIQGKAPQYRSFLYRQDILEQIPPYLSDDKIEENLHRISMEENSKINEKIEEFLSLKEIDENQINEVMDSVKKRSAYDSDKLTDYVCRRRAILKLFSRMLDQKENGTYQLESIIHNLIFPMGLTNREITYQYHNLWLLDDRFSTFRFIASDKSITSMSQIKSSKEPDLILMNPEKLVDNPICYGNYDSGKLDSMVIFEFKRPGDTAHQKNKKDFRWEFSDVIEEYFDRFQFGEEKQKKNYRGQVVKVTGDTPKFGYVIMDELPDKLIEFNKSKGWRQTPFGTYYKINPDQNLHIEVMDFQTLLRLASERNNPFFDHLFADNAHI